MFSQRHAWWLYHFVPPHLKWETGELCCNPSKVSRCPFSEHWICAFAMLPLQLVLLTLLLLLGLHELPSNRPTEGRHPQQTRPALKTSYSQSVRGNQRNGILDCSARRAMCCCCGIEYPKALTCSDLELLCKLHKRLLHLETIPSQIWTYTTPNKNSIDPGPGQLTIIPNAQLAPNLV